MHFIVMVLLVSKSTSLHAHWNTGSQFQTHCRWTIALRQLVRAVEVEHAAVHAVWTAPHAEAAFVEVVSRPLTLVTLSAQAILASRRPPEKVRSVSCTRFRKWVQARSLSVPQGLLPKPESENCQS